MGRPTLYGAAYSVYVRACRMALAEKGVAYDLVPVDVFAPGGPPAEHFARQPFGKIPAFEHDGFSLYEAGAITRYVDEAFDGPPLQPPAPRERARMSQAISVGDGFVYPDLVWGLYVPRSRVGAAPDEAKLAALRPRVERGLAALETLVDGPWIAGAALTLADLHLAPMFDLFLRTPEGRDLLPRHPRLAAWWAAVRPRDSFSATAA